MSVSRKPSRRLFRAGLATAVLGFIGAAASLVFIGPWVSGVYGNDLVFQRDGAYYVGPRFAGPGPRPGRRIPRSVYTAKKMSEVAGLALGAVALAGMMMMVADQCIREANRNGKHWGKRL